MREGGREIGGADRAHKEGGREMVRKREGGRADRAEKEKDRN